MHWEVWTQTDNGEQQHECNKFKREAAEAKREELIKRARWANVWIREVED